MRALVTGLTLPEALRTDGDGLYFSDAAAGGVYRWSKTRIETVVPKRRGVGGLALHAEGGIVISGRSLLHVHGDRTRELLSVEGTLGLNDLTTDAHGRVLVGALRMQWTDPEQGRPGELWRVGGGSPAPVLGGIAYPNGMAFAPDGRTFYVADYVGACVHAAHVAGDALTNRRVFARLDRGNADGLAVDTEGRVWVATGPGGTFDVFDAGGTLTDRVAPPTTFAVTLCFGGADGRDLYFATADRTDEPHAGGTIFVTRSTIPGVPTVPAVA